MDAESRPQDLRCGLATRVAADASDVHQEMVDMILSFWVSQTIRTIAALSLADHLATDGVTAEEIASREGSAVDTTFRVLRAGVALDLMTADADGRFYGTERLATLRKDAPRSLRPMAISLTDPAHWQSWAELASSVRSGHSHTGAAAGSDIDTYLALNPQAAEEFNAAMSSATSMWSCNLANVIDTTKVRRVVDIGGGNGTLVRVLQQANPALQAVVFDRPAVVEWARADIARYGFPDRTYVVGGDFFESVPSGDLYLLKRSEERRVGKECSS